MLVLKSSNGTLTITIKHLVIYHSVFTTVMQNYESFAARCNKVEV